MKPETKHTPAARMFRSLDPTWPQWGVTPPGWHMQTRWFKTEAEARRYYESFSHRERLQSTSAKPEGSSPKTYAQRVEELELEGLTRSDAQGVADAEVMTGKLQAEGRGE